MFLMDPLTYLPAEIVLRILDYVPISSVASLTQTSQLWHKFIDSTHQDAIYSTLSKVTRPPSCRDFTFTLQYNCFSRCFEDLTCWKDLCRIQTLLRQNWSRPSAIEHEISPSELPVWRFRADFKRRLVLSTSQAGGFSVTDMDTGESLWKLPREEVRPFAHLEYDMEKGIAVWDRFFNALEVWKADEERGMFLRIAILEHDCQPRGYQLAHDTLCVVSHEGKAFIYDMSNEPALRREFTIPEGAVGHLYQDEDVMMISMGQEGFHIYDKVSGEAIGIIQPAKCSNNYHIVHQSPRFSSSTMAGRPTNSVSLRLQSSSHPFRTRSIPLSQDEWGAGILCGSRMVSISKGGRVFVCSDWRRVLQGQHHQEVSALIEVETDISTFEWGGWLSVDNSRATFEVDDSIYVMKLAENPLPITGDDQPVIFAIPKSFAPHVKHPVSFMAVWDDSIMHTYMSRQPRTIRAAVEQDGEEYEILTIGPSKTIRVVNFASFGRP